MYASLVYGEDIPNSAFREMPLEEAIKTYFNQFRDGHRGRNIHLGAGKVYFMGEKER
jgi:hypothetical protein